MSNKYLIKGETLTNIADAIRAKTSSEDVINVGEMASVIYGISGGFPNGTEWHKGDLPDDVEPSIISYSDGLWLVNNSTYGSTNCLYYSNNGKNWFLCNTPFTDKPRFLYKANGCWVAGVYNAGLYYSYDGINWEQSNITANASFDFAYYSDGLWIAAGTGGVGARAHWSTDGKNWTRDTSAPGGMNSILYAKGVWLGHTTNTSNYGAYYYAEEKTWTKCIGLPEDKPIKFCYGGGTFLATGTGTSSGIKGLYYSKDGKTWQSSNIVDVFTSAIPVYANGIWCVSCLDKTMRYSIDGITWTVGTTFTKEYVSSIYYLNGIWIGLSGVGYGIYYSIDGKTWINSNVTKGRFYIDTVRYANGIWVCNDYGGARYSIDGKTWTASNITTNSSTYNVLVYGNGVWLTTVDNHIYYSIAWEPSS